MNPTISIVIASGGVFCGSLFAVTLRGDRIQADDVHQAIMVAAIATVMQ